MDASDHTGFGGRCQWSGHTGKMADGWGLCDTGDMADHLRIVHVYKDYFPVRGGIENHVKVLAEAQAAAGHDVTVLTCAPGREGLRETLRGVRVLRSGRLATLRSMPLSRDLVRQVRQGSPDILHVHSPFPLGEFAARHAPPGTALVATHHSDVVRQKWLLKLHAPFYRTFLARADALLPTSAAYAHTSPWLSPHADKCHVVPLGVDLHAFSPGDRAVPGSRGGLRLLFAGRLRYYKGLDTLLRALASLPSSLRLDVVGSGPMAGRWQALASRLGLADRVTFHGELDDAGLLAAYREADLFVLPCNCRAEAFGTVLLEAMACGLPCVTSEVGSGTSWVVQEGVTGRVVPPSDPVALAGVLEAAARDRPMLAAWGAAGRERVSTHFSEAHMVAAVQRVYDTVRRSAPG